MVSASKAARQAKRAADGKDDKKKTPTSKLSSKAASKASSVNGDDEPADEKAEAVKKLADQMDKHGLSDRVTTGVLASLPASRDVKITSASLVFHGKVLFNDSTLEVNYARRYGLLGENGCGKSTLLKAIDKREFPFPEHIDIYLLNEGAPPSELGALEWVVREAQNEMDRLDKLAEKILEDNGPEDPQLEDIYEVCFSLGASLQSEILMFSAYGNNGSFDVRNPCFTHFDWSWLQQDDNSQEDQGHVRWLAYACRSWKGSLREAFLASS